MRIKGKKMWWILLFSIVILVAVLVICYRPVKMMRCTYNYQEIEKCNPYIGFAPAADSPEQVGDNSLVYVDVTWRELEPEEGVYDFAGIESANHLERWRKEGKHVVFRFLCDLPGTSEHMDIPDWLYEKTGDGDFYDTEYGKGYAPNYSNSTLIQAHAEAIRALGAQYGNDDFFCYVELGSIGHWGEWHVKYDEGIRRLPGEESLKEYVLPYLTAFPQAKLLMRRPFSFVSDYGMGVYNDMAGAREDTKEWLSWIAEGGIYREPKSAMELTACPQIWETAPVGGELTSSISMEEMLGSGLEETLELLEESHMSFLGPKCPVTDGEESSGAEEMQKLRSRLGYCYGITETKGIYDIRKKTVKVSFTIKNYGTAPLYFDWPLYVYLMNENGEVTEKYQTDVSLKDIAQNETGKASVELDVPAAALQKQTDGESENLFPLVAAGIENPETGKPEIALAMDAEQDNNYYYLFRQEKTCTNY